jgi:hypothetical protein
MNKTHPQSGTPKDESNSSDLASSCSFFALRLRVFGAQPRQRAQVIKLPMATKTTGKNHLSKNFCTGRTSLSAAMPLGASRRELKKHHHFELNKLYTGDGQIKSIIFRFFIFSID